MSKILITNWKMNPVSESVVIKLARASDFRNVVVVPPFPFLTQVKKILKKASLGAQDVFYEESGAYTGEVSPCMLRSLGAEYVIIGHSERRKFLNETDEMIAKKVMAALHAKLNVVLCVGEPMSVRRKGPVAVQQFIKKQLYADLKLIKNFKPQIKNLFIAYEPIWAIGTGKNAEPNDAVEIIIFIKKLLTIYNKLQTKILYGGSVDSKNISGFLNKPEIDGALVGGASIIPSEIHTMARITSGNW